MYTFIILVVIAQFLNAIVAIIDRYILTSNRVEEPIKYAFLISTLSSLSIIVFLFSFIQLPIGSIPSFSNVDILNLKEFGLVSVVSVSFILALFFLFSGFKRSDASDVVPVVGSVAAISTLLLSYELLNTVLNTNFRTGFILLVLGTLMVSHFRFDTRTAIFAILSGIMFGINTVFMKLLFIETNFDTGFFWSRLGIFAFALLLLFTPYISSTKGKTKTTKASWGIILLNKAIAGLAAILILKAIDLGNPSLVQALGGLQFIFLLLISFMIGKKTSYSCGENCSIYDLLQKTISIAIIVIGFLYLFI